jgi:hypothetical protein
MGFNPQKNGKYRFQWIGSRENYRKSHFFSTHVFCDGMIVDKLWATATFVNCEWYGEKTYMLKDELGPFKLQQSSLMSRYDDA